MKYFPLELIKIETEGFIIIFFFYFFFKKRPAFHIYAVFNISLRI